MGTLITPINGRSGRVAVNGTPWNFDEWNGELSVETGKITGFEDQQLVNGVYSQTAENRTSGNQDLIGTLTGPLNAAQMAGTTFVPGALLQNLLLVIDKNFPVTRFCGSTQVIIKKVKYGAKQADAAQR